MTDTFPGLQDDAGKLIKQANELILKARQLRAACAQGDPEAVRDACKEIGAMAEPLNDFMEAFADTTTHFITYTEEGSTHV